MKLLMKFNLVLLVVFGLGMFLISHYAYNFLVNNAREQVLQQAELMEASATATKEYTVDKVSPILEHTPQHGSDFLAQTIPFSAANVTFKYLRSSYPDYVLQEAALESNQPLTTGPRIGKPISSTFSGTIPTRSARSGSGIRPQGKCFGWLTRWLPSPDACSAIAAFGCIKSDDQALRSRSRVRLERERSY